MAFDAYMAFMDQNGTAVPGESQSQIGTDPLGTAAPLPLATGKTFEIDDFSFDIEQVLNIGSQSSGAGAGKVKFNNFKITRKTDKLSPKLYQMCCAGTHFQQVSLYLRRSGGGATAGSMTSGTTFLRFDFRLVAVATISWSGADGDESPKEEVNFGYGALQVQYQQQSEKGGAQGAPVTTAWNQIYNNDKFATVAAS